MKEKNDDMTLWIEGDNGTKLRIAPPTPFCKSNFINFCLFFYSGKGIEIEENKLCF